MIIYRCDRCKKDIDFGSSVFDGEECLNLSTELCNCPGVINKTKSYLLCVKCKKSFEDFMNGCEVVAP